MWDLGLPGALEGGVCSGKAETGPGTLTAPSTEASAWVPATKAIPFGPHYVMSNAQAELPLT